MTDDELATHAFGAKLKRELDRVIDESYDN